MYPNGYYKFIETSECFTQSQLPLNAVDSLLPLYEGELNQSPSKREMSEGQRELLLEIVD
jgi:hypothetical protein